MVGSDLKLAAPLTKPLIVFVSFRISYQIPKTNCNNVLHFVFEMRKCFEFHLLITLHKIVDLDTSLCRSLVGLSGPIYLSLFVYLSIFLRVHLSSISRFNTFNKCNVENFLTLKTKKKTK